MGGWIVMMIMIHKEEEERKTNTTIELSLCWNISGQACIIQTDNDNDLFTSFLQNYHCQWCIFSGIMRVSKNGMIIQWENVMIVRLHCIVIISTSKLLDYICRRVSPSNDSYCGHLLDVKLPNQKVFYTFMWELQTLNLNFFRLGHHYFSHKRFGTDSQHCKPSIKVLSKFWLG